LTPAAAAHGAVVKLLPCYVMHRRHVPNAVCIIDVKTSICK